MKKLSFFTTALLSLGLVANAFATDEQIIANLKMLGAQKIEIKPSPINGLKMAVTEEGIVYASDDGKYFLQGKLFEFTDKGVVDISSKALMSTLESYKNEMIVFPAKNEKYVVTVFMDTSCGYCHKLHEQIKEYNDLGITVRYLAFPRAGMQSQAAKEMEAIFTAKDPAFALTESEKGNPPKNLKTPNIVKKHYELGTQFGVRGTPTIITQTGEVIGGYLPPKALLDALQH